MNVSNEEYIGLSVDEVQYHTLYNEVKTVVNSANTRILQRAVDHALYDVVYNNDDILSVKSNHKKPIYKKNTTDIIGIYTSCVDRTKELSLISLYQHYLDFFSDKHTATRNFLKHLSIDSLIILNSAI